MICRILSVRWLKKDAYCRFPQLVLIYAEFRGTRARVRFGFRRKRQHRMPGDDFTHAVELPLSKTPLDHSVLQRMKTDHDQASSRC